MDGENGRNSPEIHRQRPTVTRPSETYAADVESYFGFEHKRPCEFQCPNWNIYQFHRVFSIIYWYPSDVRLIGSINTQVILQNQK